MKRILMWLIVVFMAIAGAVVARAEGVPEVPPSEDKPIAGYKGGFFIQSPDENFKFVINGRLHGRWYFQKITDQESDQTFLIRRARMDFTSIVQQNFEANIAFNYGTRSNKFQNLQLLNASAAYTFDPAFKLTFGTVGMPLSIVNETSSNGWLMPEPPLVLTQEDGITAITVTRSSFGNPDGIGLWAEGDLWKFFYRFAIVNGASDTGVESNYDLNPNKRVSVGARFGFNILDAVPGIEMDLPYSNKPKLTVSMGANYQGKRKQADDATTGYIGPTINRILTASAGGAFRWRGLSLNSEAFGRKTTLGEPGTTTWFDTTMDDFGYYLNSGYFIIPNKFEVAAVGGQIFREGPDNDSYQFGGGLNWYVFGSNKLKLQTAYTLTVDYDDIAGTKNSKAHYATINLISNF